jgi:hypothetical protein
MSYDACPCLAKRAITGVAVLPLDPGLLKNAKFVESVRSHILGIGKPWRGTWHNSKYHVAKWAIGDIRHVENEAVLLENRDIGGFKCGSFVGRC